MLGGAAHFKNQVLVLSAGMHSGVGAHSCQCRSFIHDGRGTLISNSGLGWGRWAGFGCGRALVSVWVAVKCWAGHTGFQTQILGRSAGLRSGVGARLCRCGSL